MHNQMILHHVTVTNGLHFVETIHIESLIETREDHIQELDNLTRCQRVAHSCKAHNVTKKYCGLMKMIRQVTRMVLQSQRNLSW